MAKRKIKQLFNYEAVVCAECGIDQFIYYVPTLDEHYCNYCLNTVTIEDEEDESYNQQCAARNA